MIGKIYVTGRGCDPVEGKHIKDPTLGKNPSLGACRPDIRKRVQKSDHVFVVTAKVPDVAQVVLGGFEVAEKISAMEAYERFPEQHLRKLPNGQVTGNVIVTADGKQHKLDHHKKETFDQRIETVGREWAEETLPKAVEEAVRNSKRKDYLNVLDTVDFIHLGEFLFATYSKKTPQDLYAKLKEVKTEEDAKALQSFIPESNWKRYFGGLVTCEDGYLKVRWEKLYELRCKVAHNALMVKGDLDEIEKLIGEIKPKLLEAIKKLSKVKVPAEDAEAVAENAARRVNATIGEFITCWQQFESEIGIRTSAMGKPKKIIPPPDDLMKYGILDRSRADLYNEVRKIRNSIVHGPGSEIPVETIKAALGKLQELLAFVEAGYVEYLRSLSEDERDEAVRAKIDETYHEIADSDEFNSATALTNATDFSVDEYEIQDIDFDEGECVVKMTFSASGEQLEDRMFSGDRIVGNCEAAIDSDGRVEYREVHAEVDHGEDDEPEFDPGIDE